MLEPAGAAAALAAELDAATPEDPCGIIKGEQPSHIRLDSLYARTLSGGLGPLLDRVMRRRRFPLSGTSKYRPISRASIPRLLLVSGGAK